MPNKTIIGMAATMAAILFMAAACGVPSKPDAAELSARIYHMGELNQWPETMDLAKQLALAYPDHPGAHYLLAQAYLHRAEPQLVQAEGELKTAMAMHTRTGSLASTPWKAAAEFELALNRDLALVDFRWIREAIRFDLPPTQIHDKLLEAKEHVEAGLKFDAKDSFLLEMHGTIEEYLSGPYKEQTPTPSLAPAPAKKPSAPATA